jgi:uncharacterized protein
MARPEPANGETMHTAAAVDPTPWYRQRWPWLVMLPPAVAVVGCIVTITLAVRSSDGVVASDYYKRGLAINEQLARSQFAARIGLQAWVAARGLSSGDEVRVTLRAAQSVPPEAALKLRLVHPGRAGADREAMLARIAVHDDGRTVEYVGRWQESAPLGGQVGWHLVLEAGAWRLDGDASTIAGGTPLQVGAAR